MAKVYIVSGTSWAGVATDGNNITVECIGGGGGGNNFNGTVGGGGGGGGEYAKSVLAYVSESEITGIQIGQGGAGGIESNTTPDAGDNGTETHWNTNVVIAKGGGGASITGTPGSGGTGGTGDTKYNGGNGGTDQGRKYGAGGGGGGGILKNDNRGGGSGANGIIVITYTPEPVAPTVTTQACDQITKTSARGNGEITAVGSANPTIRGFCYKAGTTGDPTTADSVVNESGDFGTGTFNKTIPS